MAEDYVTCDEAALAYGVRTMATGQQVRLKYSAYGDSDAGENPGDVNPNSRKLDVRAIEVLPFCGGEMRTFVFENEDGDQFVYGSCVHFNKRATAFDEPVLAIRDGQEYDVIGVDVSFELPNNQKQSPHLPRVMDQQSD